MTDRACEYLGGTRRIVAPEQTLVAIEALRVRCGITRLADITGLDSLGVPVFAAIRPTGRLLQASQGKGVTAIDAKVSALMEAIELAHSENPTAAFTHGSYHDLHARGAQPVAPSVLHGFYADAYYNDDVRIPWVAGRELLTNSACMLPASSAYFIEPSLYSLSTNGLASGNNEQEATLHALYEIYERDTLSELVVGDSVSFDACDTIDTSTIDHPWLRTTIQRIEAAGVDVRLFRVAVKSHVHTFCVALLDPAPFANASHVSIGSGSHLNPAIAASRALTEAAQSRVTFIHGTREDLPAQAYRREHAALYEFIRGYRGDTRWRDLENVSGPSLDHDYQLVLQQLRLEETSAVFRTTLTDPGAPIAVVKVHIPGARILFSV